MDHQATLMYDYQNLLVVIDLTEEDVVDDDGEVYVDDAWDVDSP
jgi:hypothetical protein